MKDLETNKGATDIIILGAGPAGLAAALKLAGEKKTLIIEKNEQVGGICKTIKFDGCLFDLGPHRFFTKSSNVQSLWEETLGDDFLTIPRLTRIYYKNKFFNYPLKPMNALFGLGFLSSIGIILSYLWVKIFPNKKEDTFETWTSNRFGHKLYKIFFKEYTEKLWGISCKKLSSEWAAQRIKGLSLRVAIKNAIFSKKNNSIKTLIEKFNYPKYGAGMMYEQMAKIIKNNQGDILTKTEIIKIKHNGSVIKNVVTKDSRGNLNEFYSDYFISSIPIDTLLRNFSPAPPSSVREAVSKLKYRNTIIVHLILQSSRNFSDNWIYVHSPESQVLRISNMKNWGPYMVPDKNKTALNLEYVCNGKDDLWSFEDDKLIKFALHDLEKLKLFRKEDYISGFVSKVPKTYPIYENEYDKYMETIKNYLGNFKNIQVIGRYGMFKYNNMDHSILTGLFAAENILGKNHDLWNVNMDDDYHEEI